METYQDKLERLVSLKSEALEGGGKDDKHSPVGENINAPFLRFCRAPATTITKISTLRPTAEIIFHN